MGLSLKYAQPKATQLNSPPSFRHHPCMTSVLKDLGAIGPPFSTVPVRENSDSLSRTIIALKSEHRPAYETAGIIRN
jgi:hypothetical protein